MTQTHLGAAKSQARRHGLTLSEYQAKLITEAWCYSCRSWHPRDQFGPDRSRHDGIQRRCLDSRVVTKGRPGTRERRLRRSRGEAWCRGCQDWLPSNTVRPEGACQMHLNAEYRKGYSKQGGVAIRKRVSDRRWAASGMPVEAKVVLLDLFNNECVYCGGEPTTWDHLVPVIKGGQTVNGNMFPACKSCNSRKKDRDPFEWLDTIPSERVALILDHWSLLQCT